MILAPSCLFDMKCDCMTSRKILFLQNLQLLNYFDLRLHVCVTSCPKTLDLRLPPQITQRSQYLIRVFVYVSRTCPRQFKYVSVSLLYLCQTSLQNTSVYFHARAFLQNMYVSLHFRNFFKICMFLSTSDLSAKYVCVLPCQKFWKIHCANISMVYIFSIDLHLWL